MTSILGIVASSKLGAPPGAYESIATLTGSGATSINFTSIPSTYKHLQFRFIAQNTDTTNNTPFDMQINNATGTSYSWHQLIGTGGSVSATGDATRNWIEFGSLLCPGGSSQDTMSVGIIDIHDYASTTKNKTVRFFGGRERNGIQSQIFISSGLYQATTAITSVKFLSDNGTYSFSNKSSIALYGIKGV
jgi:hypothetical protein